MKTRTKAQLLAQNMEQLMVKFKTIGESCLSEKGDLSPRELQLISFVGENGSVIMKDISDELNIPMSSATGIVDRLVSKKYIIRKNSEKDRRTVIIELDQAGASFYDKYNTLKINLSHQILEILSQEEASMLIHSFEKIASRLNLNESTKKS